MQIISPGMFRVRDGEVITIAVKSTGAPTLFGVNYSIFGGGDPLQEGRPLTVTMDKSKAKGKSTILNAKSTPLTLLLSFSSKSGGKYEWTVTGDPAGDTYPDFARQVGKTPKAATYTFHIV